MTKRFIIILVSFCAVCFGCMAQEDSSFKFSSYGELVCGTAGEGIILVSKDDGATWGTMDFNKEYEGYYKPLTIKAVAAGNRTMAIAGTDSDGRPAMYFSFDGTVWSPRELSYTVGGRTYWLEDQPVDLEYDGERDRMIMYCENDTVFYVPNCSHCNSLKKVTK